MQMPAQAVQVDAHPLIARVMRCTVDDIRSGGADGPIEAQLFPADALVETRGAEQVSQPPLALVDWILAFARLT